MAATGPYILHKSTQLCLAVRSNVNLEQIHPSVLSSKLLMKFNFPDGANTLPPRINLKVLSSAINMLCEKVRVERESNKYLKRRSHHRHVGLKPRPCDNNVKETNDHNINAMKSSDVALLGAGGFFWCEERITDQDLVNCTKSLMIDGKEEKMGDTDKDKWEVLTRQDNMSVLRRQMETGIYEYKVLGSFMDINARSFFTIQIDTEYRKIWDHYAGKLEIIDRDPEGECEVLHWIMKYPYPLKSRDYVMIRRSKVDEKQKKIVLLSRATEHPKCPESQDHVRVYDYASQMVIKPHRTFNENGMDFVLHCYDNPRTTIPSVCTNYATASGIPEYIKTLHAAACNIQNTEHTYHCQKDCYSS